MLVLPNANPVWHRRILGAKEETAVALVAPLVGPRKRTVPNARRAGRVRSAMVATIARWVMQDTAAIAMRHNANNAHWVKQPRFQVRPRAMGVI